MYEHCYDDDRCAGEEGCTCPCPGCEFERTEGIEEFPIDNGDEEEEPQ